MFICWMSMLSITCLSRDTKLHCHCYGKNDIIRPSVNKKVDMYRGNYIEGRKALVKGFYIADFCNDDGCCGRCSLLIRPFVFSF